MAILHSIQSGNFTSASTWAVVDPTSYLDSIRLPSFNGSVTTTQTNTSVAFIPGAITISGVSIQIVGRVASPTGTITMRLWNGTTGTVTKDVTINASDLPNTGGATTPHVGWVYFKFDAPVTLSATAQYAIRMFSSVSNQIAVYTNGTANNYNRALVTTTTAAPAATDTLITSGDFISAGVNTTTIITMDNTSLLTQYGTIHVGSNGRFNYGVAASTNYALKIAGDVWIGRSGTFTIGTVANPIPATSTAVLEINCASSLQFQMYNFGTLETKHATTVLHRALLNADIAVGATTSTTNVSTGWRQNDVIVIPSTTRTASQHERVTLNANAVGTTLTHNATSFAHDGNATIYMQADLANLTRNIKIRSTTASFRSRFQQGLNGVTTFFDVEFFEWVGCAHNSGTATYAGSFNLQQCTFWGTVNASTVLNNLNTSSNTISSNVFYNYTDATQNIDNENLIIGFTAFQAWSGRIGNNNVISSSAQAGSSGPFRDGSTGNRFYANGGNGAIYHVGSLSSYTVTNWVFFNNGIALRFISSSSTTGSDRSVFERFENCYFYGNSTNIDMIISGATNYNRKFWFNNCFFWAGKTGLLTAIGYSAMINDYTHFTNCTFGRRPDGVDSLFTTSCLRGGQVGTTMTNCLFYGTQASFAAATFITSVNNFNGLTSLKHNGVTNDYRQYQASGFIQNDNTITYNGLPTIRISPSIATNKTFSNPVRVAVSSGRSCSINIRIRTSINLDGAAYNGSPPRLMYALNPLLGNLTETVASSYPNYNLVTQPETLSTMTPQRSALGALGTSPSGLINAYPVVVNNATALAFTGANGTNIVTGSYPAFSGTRNISAYVKAAGLNIASVMLGAATTLSSAQFLNVNLDTGAIISTNATNTNVESVGNGWYRVSLDVTSVSPTNNRVAVGFSDTVKTQGNGVDGVYVWGVQMTDGSGASPYIAGGSWQTLSYTTPLATHDGVAEFYVDCDGTTGWINIEDWSTDTFNDTRSMNYWSNVGVYIEPDWRRPGGSYLLLN